MGRCQRGRRLVAGAVLPALCLAGLGVWAAGQDGQKTFQVMAGGYYMREPTDREWHIRLKGDIPSLAGAYIVMHDAKGKIVYRGEVPHGTYPPEKPYVVTVPKDGVTGDYKFVLIGHQNDMLGVRAPFTDLPFEVYGGTNFSVGHNPAVRVYFKATPGVTKQTVGGYKGEVQVLDRKGGVVADTRRLGYKGPKGRDHLVDFTPQQGTLYRMERKCFYFRAKPAIYITFFPDRWFAPSPELDQVKWWEGAAQ